MMGDGKEIEKSYKFDQLLDSLHLCSADKPSARPNSNECEIESLIPCRIVRCL